MLAVPPASLAKLTWLWLGIPIMASCSLPQLKNNRMQLAPAPTSHEEGDGCALGASLAVQGQQVLLELVDTIGGGHTDLEHLQMKRNAREEGMAKSGGDIQVTVKECGANPLGLDGSNSAQHACMFSRSSMGGCTRRLVGFDHIRTASLRTSYPQMNDARRARDCLPLPPTPTSMALPRGRSMMRAIRVMCSMACWKRTRSITALASLYSRSLSSSAFLRTCV